MKKTLFLLLSVLCLAGCGPRYVDYFPYHDDGSAKPRIALVPIIDNCDLNDSSSVAQEITNDIHFYTMQTGEFFLVSEDSITAPSVQVDYFSNDLTFAQAYQGVDFVIVGEIVHHKATSRANKLTNVIPLSSCPPEVKLSMRVRVIDVRCAQPIVVLQEMLSYNCIATPLEKNSARQRMVADFVGRMDEVLRSRR